MTCVFVQASECESGRREAMDGWMGGWGCICVCVCVCPAPEFVLLAASSDDRCFMPFFFPLSESGKRRRSEEGGGLHVERWLRCFRQAILEASTA